MEPIGLSCALMTLKCSGRYQSINPSSQITYMKSGYPGSFLLGSAVPRYVGFVHQHTLIIVFESIPVSLLIERITKRLITVRYFWIFPILYSANLLRNPSFISKILFLTFIIKIVRVANRLRSFLAHRYLALPASLVCSNNLHNHCVCHRNMQCILVYGNHCKYKLHF